MLPDGAGPSAGSGAADTGGAPAPHQESPMYSPTPVETHAPARSRRTLVVASSAIAAAFACGLAALGTATAQTAPPDRPHRVVFQVSDADPAKWALALNNVRNVLTDLGRDAVSAEIVAYGPGIGMLKMDSVVGPRVAEAMAAGVSVVACENTMKNQKVSRDDMLPRIGYVEAGVVQLMKRQRDGWSYIRP
jgi:intracellular sulfur oxidation DsrE/DsrF family protein